MNETLSAYDLSRVCRHCGEPCWRSIVRADGSRAQTVCCDDQWFDVHGDMLSINELRPLKLRNRENIRCRREWIADYEQRGLHPDRDPSLTTWLVTYTDAPAGTSPR